MSYCRLEKIGVHKAGFPVAKIRCGDKTYTLVIGNINNISCLKINVRTLGKKIQEGKTIEQGLAELIASKSTQLFHPTSLSVTLGKAEMYGQCIVNERDVEWKESIEESVATLLEYLKTQGVESGKTKTKSEELVISE